MGDGEPGRPALSLEQCVTKAHEFTKLKRSDPVYKLLLRVWIAQTKTPAEEYEWATRKHLDGFLRRPSSPAFSMLQRAWYKAFLKLHLAVAVERLRS